MTLEGPALLGCLQQGTKNHGGQPGRGRGSEDQRSNRGLTRGRTGFIKIIYLIENNKLITIFKYLTIIFFY